MTQISGANARYLNPPVVLSEVFRVMEPALRALEMIPKVDSGGQPIIYARETGKSADAKKQMPRAITASGGFPEVGISRLTKTTALTSAEGLSVRIDADAMRLPSGKAIIADSLAKVGYWMAEYLNLATYAALDGGSTDDGLAFAAQWSAANATPIKDLTQFKNSMIRSGRPFRMTDIYMDELNFSELEQFLVASELPAYNQAATNMPITDQIVLPIEGNPIVHRMVDGVTHGDLLGIDARMMPAIASMYYHNDPMFGTPATVSYETVEAGKAVTKTVDNFGLNVHTFFEDKTHDTIVQVWADTVPVVKDAFGIISGDGI